MAGVHTECKETGILEECTALDFGCGLGRLAFSMTDWYDIVLPGPFISSRSICGARHPPVSRFEEAACLYGRFDKVTCVDQSA